MPDLIEAGRHFWLAEGSIVNFYSFAYPTRSAIVRLDNGDLWVWSPIKLTAKLRREVDNCGPVKHLVSPNKLHHLFLGDWAAAYPDAKIWGPASTQRKRRDLCFQPPLGNDAPPDWRGQIDQVWFRGSLLLDEIEFYHRASSTAIIADMSQTFNESFLETHWRWWQRPIARFYRITKGNGYAPLEVRLTTTDRALARKSLNDMLLWRPRQVVVAHGDIVTADGASFLSNAFSWLQA